MGYKGAHGPDYILHGTVEHNCPVVVLAECNKTAKYYYSRKEMRTPETSLYLLSSNTAPSDQGVLITSCVYFAGYLFSEIT